MSVDQVLSRNWVKDARHEYNDRLLDIETDAGECIQECCRRDVKNQVYSAKMNSRLKDFDPSSQATRIQGISLAPQACTSSALAQGAPSQQAGPMLPDERMSASAPAEDQREMDELRQQRRQAILQSRKKAMAAANAGFGSLRDVSASTAQEIVREAPAAVVHVWDAGFAADLDELLTMLALRHPGTRVVRAPLSRCGDWLQRLRRPAEPLLLAAKRGRVIGAVAVAELTRLTDSGDGGAESAAEGWLKCLGVLRAKAPAMTTHGGTAAAAAEEESSDEEGGGQEDDEWRTPCGICGRTYPHTHKRAVRKGGGRSGSGSDSDGE